MYQKYMVWWCEVPHRKNWFDRLVYIITYYKLQLFNLWEKETIPTRLTNISTIIILPILILIIFECELEEFAGCVSDRNCDYISIQKRLEERIQCTVWRYTTVLTYLYLGTANWTRKTTVWAFITVPSYEGCWSHSALCSDVPRQSFLKSSTRQGQGT